jgi:endoglucanase Acf2/regulation of enolase protein 1 (concanavalin A-like superfamily)
MKEKCTEKSFLMRWIVSIAKRHFYQPKVLILTARAFLLTLFISAYAYSQTVPVGSGSYTTVFPGTDQAGRNGFPSGTPYLSGVAASKPVPTNDWWSSFMKRSFGESVFNYPLAYRSLPSGLSINLIVPNPSPIEYRQPMSDVNGVIVGVSNLNVANTTVSNHSDWTVTVNWNGGGNFNATMGVGMPFTYFTKGSSDIAKITVPFNPQNVTVSGNKIIIQNNFSGANYVVYGPAGTVWSGSNGVYTSNLNGKNYWSMVMVPTGANVNTTATEFEKYAFVFPGNTQASWNYTPSNGIVKATFTVTPDVKEGVFNTFLQGLLPHQWSRLAPESAQPTAISYTTVRGQMKMLASNTFVTQNKFSGILPNLPNLAKYSASFDPGSMYKKVDLLKNSGLPEWTDSYNQGMEMNALIQTAHIAHQIGHIEARDKLINTVKTRLEDWFKAEGGEVAFLFYYNNDWKTLFGYPAGHRQDTNINDHHFHWGYFIHAAAAIEQYQPGWAANWGPMVNLLIRDAASLDRNDPLFPYLRNFNVYQGHAWANGMASEPHGNDQESTSESMQFNSSLIHWGTLTGNTQIRDLGVFLYTTEQSAIEEYWYDVNDRTFHSSYQSDMIARLWGGGYDNDTWWVSNNAAASYGIQLYPIHGGALYMGHNTAYVEKIWNSLKAKTSILQNTPDANVWHDVYWSYLSFINPAEAINLYNAYPGRSLKLGVSDAQTYHWIHTMNAMGQVMDEVTANHPIAAVFNKSGVKTYVAHNYGASAITVTYSDGFSMSVPARSTVTNRDINATATVTANTLQVPKNGSVNLSATVTGSGITKVDFYRNSTFISSDASAPYTATASNLTAGLPNFYAKVYIGTNHNVSNVVTVQVGSQIPYPGPAIPAIPGTIQSGNFDAFEGGSGQGISYSDVTPWNEGGFRQTEAVDAGVNTTEGNTVGWIDSGEWLEYTINAAQAGSYDLKIRYASGLLAGGGPFWIENEAGSKISPNMTVPFTDNEWSVYQDATFSGINLAAGVQIIRVKIGTGGFNLGRMTFTFVGGGDITPPTVPTNLASPSKTTTSVSLTWSASTDPAPGAVAGYEVFVNEETTARATVTTTSVTINGLTANTPYTFKVRAKDAVPNFSAFSSPLTVTTESSPSTLPSPWVTSDVGAVAASGSASHSSGTFTVAGSGADIWGTADEFRYVYQPVTGDVTLTARIVSLTNSNSWAKAGVMIRETTAANAKHASTIITPTNGLSFQRRAIAGGGSEHTGSGGSAPYWLRIKRVGNVFTSEISTNGSSWSTVGTQTISMTSTVQVGLAVTSHADGSLCTAIFDNVVVSTTSNVPVTGVSVTPAIVSLALGGTQSLTATVAPSNATNKNVTWSSSNTSVATVSNGLVSAVGIGNATITVTTVDGNRQATSSVSVTGASNLALNKATTTSSVENATLTGASAVDGNGSTRWSSAFSDPQWIYVDLNATYSVNRVKITWEAAYGSNYQVQISSNATSWSDLKTITGNSALVNDHTGLSGTGRYIRIYGTTRGTPYGYSIFELEVYGTLVSGARGIQDGVSILPEKSEEEMLESSIDVYPNPVIGETLTIKRDQETTIKIFNVNGLQVTGKSTDEKVDVSNLTPGVYTILLMKNNKVVQRRFTKQ